MATLMEEDVDSESGSQNGLRGADVQDPSLHEKEGSIWRHRRRQRPQGKRKAASIRSRTTVPITTLYGLTYNGREL